MVDDIFSGLVYSSMLSLHQVGDGAVEALLWCLLDTAAVIQNRTVSRANPLSHLAV